MSQNLLNNTTWQEEVNSIRIFFIVKTLKKKFIAREATVKIYLKKMKELIE